MCKETSRNFKLTSGMETLAGKDTYFRPQHMNCSGPCCLWLLSGMFFLFLMFAPVAYCGAALSDTEKAELYSQGTEYFQQAIEISESDPAAAASLYAKALLRFERLAEEGNIKNGKLYYNIGNIHFLLDDIGRAILNYRRAEQYSPNDPNLAKNLAYARSMRRDKVDIQDQEKILQTLFFFHYDLGLQTRVVLFAIFYITFWFFAGIKIFSRRPFTSWGLGVTLLFTVLFGTSLLVESRQSTMKTGGVILAEEVIGYQGDADSYQPSFEDPLHAGTEFKLLEDRGGWWQIELPDGRSTWISAKSGELVGKR
jgi:tetratricopeptide (TPR) repeat protein